MNIITSLIGLLLLGLGADGYFNNGAFTGALLTPNSDIAMTMMVLGVLVLLCSLCLCEFRKHPARPAHKHDTRDALTH